MENGFENIINETTEIIQDVENENNIQFENSVEENTTNIIENDNSGTSFDTSNTNTVSYVVLDETQYSNIENNLEFIGQSTLLCFAFLCTIFIYLWFHNLFERRKV